MHEILFSHAEFLTMLAAVKAQVIVGTEAGKLFPQEREERERLLRQGRALLRQRDLLTVNGQFNADLLRAARIIAYPRIAMIIIREVIAIGPQLFLLYQSQEGAIEHTYPKEGVHRLALIPDLPALLARATQILSLHEQDPIKASVEIEQNAFVTLYDLTRHPQHNSALEMLQRTGVPPAAAEAFVTALEKPIFSGHAVLLRCVDQTIFDARDIVVVQDQKTAWYALQRVAGQPLLLFKSVHARAMYEVLSQCYAELAEQHSVTSEA